MFYGHRPDEVSLAPSDTHNTNSSLPPLLHDLLGVLHSPGFVLDRAVDVQPQHVPEVGHLSLPHHASPALTEGPAVSEDRVE